MNFGKSTYIFDDPRVRQIADSYPGQHSSISAMVLGYVLRTIANVANRETHPLPRFSFGEDLGRGFRYMLVGLVWAILLLSCPF